ncbi:MAG: hypothetical protein ACRDI2_18960, partial [Chloroflexota bacterium]
RNRERNAGEGDTGGTPVVLSATDPAQVFGTDSAGGPLRFPRVPSAAVALDYGEPVAVMDVTEAGAASVTAVSEHPALVPALRSLAGWWAARLGRRTHLKVERWDGEPALGGDGVAALEVAGFVRDGGAMLWAR